MNTAIWSRQSTRHPDSRTQIFVARCWSMGYFASKGRCWAAPNRASERCSIKPDDSLPMTWFSSLRKSTEIRFIQRRLSRIVANWPLNSRVPINRLIKVYSLFNPFQRKPLTFYLQSNLELHRYEGLLNKIFRSVIVFVNQFKFSDWSLQLLFWSINQQEV